jgi:hypothetical protein
MNLLNPEDLRDHLSDAPGGDDEALLNHLTEGVWDYWCKRTGRQWAYGAYVEYFSVPFTGQRTLYLRETPIASITSIHDDPLNWEYGAASLLDPADYVFDADTGIVHRKYDLYTGDRNIKAVYLAGYTATTFPEAYRQACYMQAARQFMRAKRFEGFEAMDELVPEFRDLTDMCRRRPQ